MRGKQVIRYGRKWRYEEGMLKHPLVEIQIEDESGTELFEGDLLENVIALANNEDLTRLDLSDFFMALDQILVRPREIARAIVEASARQDKPMSNGSLPSNAE